MEGTAACGPAASYCLTRRLTFLFTHLKTKEASHQLLPNRMSVFHRLTPLLSDTSASCRQTSEHPKAGLLPPLSSPVIRKKAIHIPSFDEKGLMFKKSDLKPPAADVLLDLVSNKEPDQSWMSEVRQKKKRENGQRASTVNRIEPKTCCSPRLPANPKNNISAKTGAPPLYPILKSKAVDSSHSATSNVNFYATSHQPKPRVSPNSTSQRSPSQSSQCSDIGSREERSPVAKEKSAHSILISNSRNPPCDKAKHEILDQRALMDFTHSRLRILPVMSKEHCTESCRSSNSQNSNKFRINEPENAAIDHLTTPVRFVEAKSKIQQQQECQSGETVHCFSQHPDFRCRHQSEDQVLSVRGAVNPKMSFSSQPPPSFSESGSRRLESTRVDAAPLSGSHPRQENVIPTFSKIPSKFSGQHGSPQDIKPQIHRLPSKSWSPQVDTDSAESWSDCVSKGFNCQSRDINQKPEAPLCAQRLNRLTTGLLAPHIQEFSRSVSAGLSLQPGLPPNPEPFPASRKSHKEVHIRVTHLNQTGILQPPDLHAVPAKPPEHPRPPSVGHCPLITNSPSSMRVSDLRLHRTCQNPEEGATASPQQTITGKALFHEESEDPYYVTMFHPGSVYVGEYKHPDDLN